MLNLLPFTLRTWIKELLNCTDVAASRSDGELSGERESCKPCSERRRRPTLYMHVCLPISIYMYVGQKRMTKTHPLYSTEPSPRAVWILLIKAVAKSDNIPTERYSMNTKWEHIHAGCVMVLKQMF